jgi:hypothetical protein
MRKLKNPIESTALAGGKLRYRKLKREIVLVNRPDYKMDQPVGKQKVVQQKFRQAAHYNPEPQRPEDNKEHEENKITSPALGNPPSGYLESSTPSPSTPLKISPSLLILSIALKIVNCFSDKPFFTSSQCSGMETVAPGFGRSE